MLINNFPGTHIRNTSEAKAFAIIKEEGIAKGVRRITALTDESALNAINLASLLEKEVEDASKAEGTALEEKVTSLKRQVVDEKAVIPEAKKADIKAKIALLQKRLRKAQKEKAEQNLKKAIRVATEAAESAALEEKAFCIAHVDVGLDTPAVREAVSHVVKNKGMSIMMLSKDETTNKVVLCAGVPDTLKQVDVNNWLTSALGPLKGGGGKGKGGLASGQGTDASQMHEALHLAESFAAMKLNSRGGRDITS